MNTWRHSRRMLMLTLCCSSIALTPQVSQAAGAETTITPLDTVAEISTCPDFSPEFVMLVGTAYTTVVDTTNPNGGQTFIVKENVRATLTGLSSGTVWRFESSLVATAISPGQAFTSVFSAQNETVTSGGGRNNLQIKLTGVLTVDANGNVHADFLNVETVCR